MFSFVLWEQSAFQCKKCKVSFWDGLFLSFPKHLCAEGLSKASGLSFGKKEDWFLLPDIQTLL